MSIACCFLISLSSLYLLVTKTHNVSFGQFSVRARIDTRIRLVVLRQVDLGLVVNAEVGQLCLGRAGNLASDVGHLQSLLSQVPLIPVIVWLNVFLHKVGWTFNALVHHQRS